MYFISSLNKSVLTYSLWHFLVKVVSLSDVFHFGTEYVDFMVAHKIRYVGICGLPFTLKKFLCWNKLFWFCSMCQPNPLSSVLFLMVETISKKCPPTVKLIFNIIRKQWLDPFYKRWYSTSCSNFFGLCLFSDEPQLVVLKWPRNGNLCFIPVLPKDRKPVT